MSVNVLFCTDKARKEYAGSAIVGQEIFMSSE